VVSYVLRHRPWEFELELDQEGWVPVEQLLDALRRDPAWSGLTRIDLEVMIATATKQRYELTDGRIRALYGHSAPVKIAREPVSPPDVLYHGTARNTLPSIQKDGLLPKGRQFVHLSTMKEIAYEVGRRKDSKPVILEVDAASGFVTGILFYRASEQTFITDHVPAVFLRITAE